MKRRGTWKVAQSGGWLSLRMSVMTWLGLFSRVSYHASLVDSCRICFWGSIGMEPTYRKTCFCPSLKAGALRATAEAIAITFVGDEY